jgi:hypothetical protein
VGGGGEGEAVVGLVVAAPAEGVDVGGFDDAQLVGGGQPVAGERAGEAVAADDGGLEAGAAPELAGGAVDGRILGGVRDSRRSGLRRFVTGAEGGERRDLQNGAGAGRSVTSSQFPL